MRMTRALRRRFAPKPACLRVNFATCQYDWIPSVYAPIASVFPRLILYNESTEKKNQIEN